MKCRRTLKTSMERRFRTITTAATIKAKSVSCRHGQENDVSVSAAESIELQEHDQFQRVENHAR